MKIQLGEYEITINAKKGNLTTREATESFLNNLSILYFEASEYNKSIGCTGSANHYKMVSDYIYHILKQKGVYD